MNDLANNLLPEKLKQLRTAKGLKQSTVAAELDIEQSTYSNYETGKRRPNPDVLYKLSILYEVSIDMLMKLAAKDISDSSDFEYSFNEQLDCTDKTSIKEMSNYLEFVNNPYNREKCKRLSARETELIYYYGQLSDSDQEDFLDFMKIRIRKGHK